MNTLSTLRASVCALGLVLSATAGIAQTSPAVASDASPAVSSSDKRATVAAQAPASLGVPSAALKTERKPNPWYWYSDARLKQDITLLDRLPNGLGLYSYRYTWSDTLYVGVMAQEVAAVMPEAVIQAANGYLAVNYAQLGLQFVTLEQWAQAQTP